MTNVSVTGPITVFGKRCHDPDQANARIGLDDLRSREMAERAAAKNSPSAAARRIHQELAMMYAARQRAEADRG